MVVGKREKGDIKLQDKATLLCNGKTYDGQDAEDWAKQQRRRGACPSIVKKE